MNPDPSPYSFRLDMLRHFWRLYCLVGCPYGETNAGRARWIEHAMQDPPPAEYQATWWLWCSACARTYPLPAYYPDGTIPEALPLPPPGTVCPNARCARPWAAAVPVPWYIMRRNAPTLPEVPSRAGAFYRVASALQQALRQQALETAARGGALLGAPPLLPPVVA